MDVPAISIAPSLLVPRKYITLRRCEGEKEKRIPADITHSSMDFTKIALGNPFEDMPRGNCPTLGRFDQLDYAVNNRQVHNMLGEDDIVFHAMDLEPIESSRAFESLDLSDISDLSDFLPDLDTLDTFKPLSPLVPPTDEWLKALVPKSLNVVGTRDLFRLRLSQLGNENGIVRQGLGMPWISATPKPAEPIEEVVNKFDTLSLGVAAVSPCSSASDLSETPVRKTKLLWGQNGLLGLKEEAPSTGARRKSGLIRTMTKKLKHQFSEIVSYSLHLCINADLISNMFLQVDESNMGFKLKSSSPVSAHAPGSSAASLITSMDAQTQAKLYSELEVMICNTANAFILQQYYDGRVSQHSIDKVNAAWNAKNNHHVVEFRYDQATQRDLILANRRNMEFTGDSSRFPITLQSNLLQWKKIAREMTIRTFCLPDSAIRKHLYDLRKIIEMMNPSLETLRALEDLCIWTQNQMLDKATADRRQSEARLKRGF